MNCKNHEIVEMIQSFIHTMNDKSLRTEIIEYHLKKNKIKNAKWLGTWMVELKNQNLELIQQNDKLPFFDNSIQKYITLNKNSFLDHIGLFTVCIIYEVNLVHFVSFICDPFQKKLISFDPGVELYLHGQNTILPLIRKAFYKNKLIQGIRIVPQQNIGRCTQYSFCGKKWGVQYNGNHNTSLPADSFCQTWTIFFLVTFIKQKNFDFVAKWCDTHPNQREFIVIKEFMIPYLIRFKNVRQLYIEYLNNHYDLKEIIQFLKAYITTCNKKQAIKCPI